MTNQAEKFANLFNNDGQCFTTDDDRDFDAVAEAMNAEVTFSSRSHDRMNDNYDLIDGFQCNHIADDPIRYQFQDGSAIVVAGCAWDHEGDVKYSWKG